MWLYVFISVLYLYTYLYIKHKIFFIFLILFLSYYTYIDRKNMLKNTSYDSNIPIPRLIHQIAPQDITRWHSSWLECYNTWKVHFPVENGFVFKLWNDEQDLDQLIHDHFPVYKNIVEKMNYKIQKIDFCRYLILYLHGGIYIDMDFFCQKPFFDQLDRTKVNLVESPFVEAEYVQNSLMASPPFHPFWLKLADQIAQNVLMDYNHPLICINETSGCATLSAMYYQNQDLVHILPKDQFNPIYCKAFDDPNNPLCSSCFCKHFGTGGETWVPTLNL